MRIADVRTQKGAAPDMDKVKAAAEAFAAEMEREDARKRFERPPDRIFHYGPPENAEALEPLIRPICERINQSGWLWTVESCEGHPEDYKGSWWGFPNPDPMLRFGCRTEHVGHLVLLLKLATATAAPNSVPEMYPGAAPCEEWSDFLTYIRGQDSREKRREAYAVLAELAHTNPPREAGAPQTGGKES